MADHPTDPVRLRNPDTGEEIERTRGAAPFFINQGYVVIDARGHVNTSATTAAAKTPTEK